MDIDKSNNPVLSQVSHDPAPKTSSTFNIKAMAADNEGVSSGWLEYWFLSDSKHQNISMEKSQSETYTSFSTDIIIDHNATDILSFIIRINNTEDIWIQSKLYELEVMDIVWRKGRVTVQDVVDALERSLAYTTVMTTLTVLENKRRVVKRFKLGRAYVYEPMVTREQVGRSMAGELTQHLFHGSVKSLVLGMIEAESMSQSDIEELKEAIVSLEADQ